MSRENKLVSGWLAKDIQRASKRVDQWSQTEKKLSSSAQGENVHPDDRRNSATQYISSKAK